MQLLVFDNCVVVALLLADGAVCIVNGPLVKL